MSSVITVVIYGNTVLTGAILKPVTTEERAMDKNVFSYCSAMAQARRLMCDGIINTNDYERIDTVLLQKYNLQLSSLYRDRDLIIAAAEGNIPHYKEGDLWIES